MKINKIKQNDLKKEKNHDWHYNGKTIRVYNKGRASGQAYPTLRINNGKVYTKFVVKINNDFYNFKINASTLKQLIELREQYGKIQTRFVDWKIKKREKY